MKRFAYAAVAAFGLFCWVTLDGPDRELHVLSSLLSFLKRLLPPDFSRVHGVGPALWESIQMGTLGTIFGSAISLVLASVSSTRLMPLWISLPGRALLSSVRAIPALVWALLAVALVGPNPLAGVLGLSVYTVGYLGKSFADSMDAVDVKSIESLNLSGASFAQRIRFGVWPELKPLFLSQCLWMWEYNLRSASIVGLVGAGGLGTLLYAYQETYAWQRFSAVLCILLGFVLLIEIFSIALRKVLQKPRS